MMGGAPQTFPVAPPRPGPELTLPRPERAVSLASLELCVFIAVVFLKKSAWRHRP